MSDSPGELVQTNGGPTPTVSDSVALVRGLTMYNKFSDMLAATDAPGTTLGESLPKPGLPRPEPPGEGSGCCVFHNFPGDS